MKRLPMLTTFAVFLLVPVWGTLPGSAWAQDRLQPQRVTWEALQFRAKSLVVELTAGIQLQSLTAAQAQAVLLESPQGAPIAASGPQTPAPRPADDDRLRLPGPGEHHQRALDQPG